MRKEIVNGDDMVDVAWVATSPYEIMVRLHACGIKRIRTVQPPLLSIAGSICSPLRWDLGKEKTLIVVGELADEPLGGRKLVLKTRGDDRAHS